MIRIFGGRLKMREIRVPKGTDVRPTLGRVRKSLFDSCQHEIEGALFCDLFAGSGSMGFEALSRGAKSCTFVENDDCLADSIAEHVSLFGVGDRAKLLRLPLPDALERFGGPFDIIYVDPPYGKDGLTQGILDTIGKKDLLKPQGRLFVEEHKRLELTCPLELQCIKEKNFGRSKVWEYARV